MYRTLLFALDLCHNLCRIFKRTSRRVVACHVAGWVFTRHRRKSEPNQVWCFLVVSAPKWIILFDCRIFPYQAHWRLTLNWYVLSNLWVLWVIESFSDQCLIVARRYCLMIVVMSFKKWHAVRSGSAFFAGFGGMYVCLNEGVLGFYDPFDAGSLRNWVSSHVRWIIWMSFRCEKIY